MESTTKRVGVSIKKFINSLENEIGYEEGSNDDDRAVGLAIQSAVDAHWSAY